MTRDACECRGGGGGRRALLPSGPRSRVLLKFVAKRLAQMALLFFLFLSIVFFLLQAQPGDITCSS